MRNKLTVEIRSYKNPPYLTLRICIEFNLILNIVVDSLHFRTKKLLLMTETAGDCYRSEPIITEVNISNKSPARAVMLQTNFISDSLRLYYCIRILVAVNAI